MEPQHPSVNATQDQDSLRWWGSAQRLLGTLTDFRWSTPATCELLLALAPGHWRIVTIHTESAALCGPPIELCTLDAETETAPDELSIVVFDDLLLLFVVRGSQRSLEWWTREGVRVRTRSLPNTWSPMQYPWSTGPALGIIFRSEAGLHVCARDTGEVLYRLESHGWESEEIWVHGDHGEVTWVLPSSKQCLHFDAEGKQLTTTTLPDSCHVQNGCYGTDGWLWLLRSDATLLRVDPVAGVLAGSYATDLKHGCWIFAGRTAHEVWLVNERGSVRRALLRDDELTLEHGTLPGTHSECVCMSPTREHLLGVAGSTLAVLNTETLQSADASSGPRGATRFLAFSLDAKKLVAVTEEGTVLVADTERLETEWEFEQTEASVAWFSADGRRVFTLSTSTFTAWCLEQGEELVQRDLGACGFYVEQLLALACSSTGLFVAIGAGYENGCVLLGHTDDAAFEWGLCQESPDTDPVVFETPRVFAGFLSESEFGIVAAEESQYKVYRATTDRSPLGPPVLLERLQGYESNTLVREGFSTLGDFSWLLHPKCSEAYAAADFGDLLAGSRRYEVHSLANEVIEVRTHQGQTVLRVELAGVTTARLDPTEGLLAVGTESGRVGLLKIPS